MILNNTVVKKYAVTPPNTLTIISDQMGLSDSVAFLNTIMTTITAMIIGNIASSILFAVLSGVVGGR